MQRRRLDSGGRSTSSRWSARSDHFFARAPASRHRDVQFAIDKAAIIFGRPVGSPYQPRFSVTVPSARDRAGLDLPVGTGVAHRAGDIGAILLQIEIRLADVAVRRYLLHKPVAR